MKRRLPTAALAFFFAAVAVLSDDRPAFEPPPVVRESPVRRRADDVLAELRKAIGAETVPGTLHPGPPPVSEKDDPVAALDADAVEAEKRSFGELSAMLQSLDASKRFHPLSREERDAVAAWFSANADFVATAEAISAPGYRSCLAGPSSFREAADGLFGPWHEPRAMEAPDACELLFLRARAALAAGDGTAGADAARRIGNLAALWDGEPPLVAFYVAAAIRNRAFDLVSERIDLWSEDDLLALQRAADDASERVERRFREAFAREIALSEALFGTVERETARMFPGGALARGASAFLIDSSRLATYRYALESWQQAEAVLGKEEAVAVADEIKRLCDDEARREKELPRLPSALHPTLLKSFLGAVADARNRAAFVRAAVAVERFRRANGGALPTTLAALVPDYLPAVPRAAFSGEPLLYEPGPVEIPEERFPVLADPDEAAARSDAEWRAKFGDAKLAPLSGIVETALAEADGNPDFRTLPAETMPGFRLTLPAGPGRPGFAIPFVLSTGPAEPGN